MEEIVVNLGRGVLLCSGFHFLVGLLGVEKWFGSWEIDRKTVIIMSIVSAFGGVALLAIGGAA